MKNLEAFNICIYTFLNQRKRVPSKPWLSVLMKMSSYPGLVLWIDPRTQIHKRIDDAIADIPCHGFMSVSNNHGARVKDIVSPTVLTDLKIEPVLRKVK